VLGQVDDDAFARRVGQDETPRDQDLGAGAGQPGIDPGIGGDDLLVTDAEAAIEIAPMTLSPLTGSRYSAARSCEATNGASTATSTRATDWPARQNCMQPFLHMKHLF
jgi:hypothetical protein